MAGTVTYTTCAQFLQMYDQRRVGELCSDTGIAITPAALLTDPVLQAALSYGAAKINAAVRAGQKYSLDNLMMLALGTDPVSVAIASDPNFSTFTGPQPSTFHIRRINADLAFGFLTARRGLSIEELNKQAPMFGMSMNEIEALSQGAEIFDLPGAASAGLPSVVRMGKDKDRWSIGGNRRLWGFPAGRHRGLCD